MKIKSLSASRSEFSPTPKFTIRLLGLAGLLLSMTTAQATNLIWDANSIGGPSDGSGTWGAANKWWNGAADQTWADGNGVIFGANTVGTYSIVLGSSVTTTNLAFKTNSYSLSGSTMTYSLLTVSNGVTAAVNCALTTAGGGCNVGNGGASLTFGGGHNSTGGNPNFNGSSQAGSTLNITNGTYTSGGTETYNNITVNQTGGAVAYAIWNIGRTASAIYNLSGGTIRNTTVGAFSISRGFPGIVNVSGTGILGTFGSLSIAGNTTNDVGTLNVLGGTVNVGSGIAASPGVSVSSVSNITLLAVPAGGGYATFAKAALNIFGGIVTAKGIIFGSAASAYTNNPVCQFNMTGGVFYVDAGGIALGGGVSGLNTLAVNLSGGTLAATANWTASVPMKVNTTNGNLTVQACNINASPFNITLAGGLTGPGGIIKTGGGNLTLSGTNSYAGTTTVVNGQLTLSNALATSIGPVSLNAGTTLSTVLAAKGQSWTNTGCVLTNGDTLDFNFASVQLSPSVSVIRVNGDLSLDSSDSVTIEGNALLVGTYPLMTCSGTLTLTGGTLPTITSLPGGVTASLARSGNTINLVVSSSPNVFISWGPLASGPWDFTTTDWISSNNGSATNYTDGIALDFDDNGRSAVAITLNTTVQPGNVTANNTTAGTASYTVSGTGSIGGNTTVLLQGSGLLALGTANTYTGGTIVNSGTLGINYGGNGSGPSAIGTGPLTLNPGVALDNTSGSNVVLNTPLTENWNGSFSYVGSQTNLDLGAGSVILGNNLTVTVQSNVLSCGGIVTDNGSHYSLTVQGPGALTLSGLNTYSGGTSLNSGKLNINNGGDGLADSAIGTGTLTINGGTIDNTSGAPLQLQTAIPESWNAGFTFAGSTNLDLGTGTLSVSALTLMLQNGMTLRTQGAMNAVGSGAVATMTLNGNGTFQTSGNKNNLGLSVVVGGGVTYLMDKASGTTIHSAQGGLTVLTNGLAKVTGTGGRQIINSSLGPIALTGGTLDLNGSSENMYQITFNSGTLQNSSASAVTLTLATNIILKSAACNFDVATNSAMTIPAFISGTGSLTKIGYGTLNLSGTNTYTGATTVSNGLITVTTATLANRNYTVAGGALEAILDPTGGKLQMAMSNLSLVAGTRLGFDLAAGAFGDTTAPLIAAGALTMNGNVAVDVSNAPGDTGDNLLLSYTNRQGAGVFVAGNVPAGAFIYDNTANKTVSLTYTNPPPSAPTFTSVAAVKTGGVVAGLTFSAVHGPAGGAYQILSSSDVTLKPLSAWTVVQSGNFDAAGSLNVTITVNPADPQMFYLLHAPY